MVLEGRSRRAATKLQASLGYRGIPPPPPQKKPQFLRLFLFSKLFLGKASSFGQSKQELESPTSSD